jgi:hypothetical protein
MLLHEYLASVRQAIEKFDIYGYAETIDIREEVRAGRQAIIKISVTLVDGSSLHGKEYISAKQSIEKVSYGYQYQDRNGNLIFRYDNASHKPALTYIQHKHLYSGDIVEAELPAIDELVDEVIGHL